MGRDIYDMSLRFWSDDAPMEPLVRNLDVAVGRLYVRGQTIVLAKGRSRPIARRHYASVAGAKTSDEAGISAWLDDTLHRLGAHLTLSDLVRSGQVEALLWIATLGGDPGPTPVQDDPSQVAAATRLGARVLLEDYTRYDDGGVPLKTRLN